MGTAESIFFWSYVAAGPFAWVVFAYLISVGRERMTKLRNAKAGLPESPPRVSILVPAKDEGSHIRTCIDRVMQQDYPSFDVIAINDRSIDDTGRVLDEMAVGWGSFSPSPTSQNGGDEPHPVMRVVHIDHLPEGWLGKCHALYKGTEHAAGEWFFFVDSDVKLQPDALSKLVAYAVDRKADALSITTTVETEFFIERLMLPLLAASWATMFAADQTNEDSQPDRAVANGQVFLIRAEAYRKVNGHEAVKDRIVEDVELMRTLKKAAFKTRFLAGRHLASTRMHTHLRQMFHGWARIFAGTARGSVWPMVLTIAFLIVCVLSVYVAGAWWLAGGAWWWGVAAGAHLVLMTVQLGLIWFWTGNSPLYALLAPISVPIEIAILGFSIRKAVSGRIEWRGSQLSLRETA